MYLSIMNEHIILVKFILIDLMQLMILTENNFLKNT